MTPPPPHMRYDLRHGFVDDGPLAGEAPDLGDLEHATADQRHRAAVAGLVAIALYVAIMILLTCYVATQQWAPAPGPTVTPSTYGWPGPTGGPTR